VTANIDDDGDFTALMRAAQAGDPDAYVELLIKVAPRVRRIVRARWTYVGEDIEDITQDTLLSLHAVRATYDPQRPFMPWLFAIIKNRIADAARRHARRTRKEIDSDEDQVTFSSLAANSKMEAYPDMDALRHAIDALPPAQRSAIDLLKLQEMSLKEAAAKSGMSAGSLKVATHRAISALRKKLLKAK
jgi:RNA polymerase sigma-70 factor, ECF subfamily